MLYPVPARHIRSLPYCCVRKDDVYIERSRLRSSYPQHYALHAYFLISLIRLSDL